ncbi:MAG: hypothetical protein AAGC44_08470 [Planctomycetota bacterium]
MNTKACRRALMVWCLLVSLATWPGGVVSVFGQDGAESVEPQTVEPAPADADVNISAPDSRPDLQSLPAGATVAIIPIQGTIYGFTLDSLKRRVERAVNAGADLIVIELDTPGGLVDAALDISSYINTIPVPTVAWVNREAFSAGILIASACDEIVMAKSSLTGDCAPIVPGMNLAPTERAKQLSPLLEAFRANADANHGGASGSDYAMFHAMCVLGIEVYQVRHKQTGEVRLVNAVDYTVMVNGQSPDEFVAPGMRGGSTPRAGESVIDRPTDYDEVAGASLTIAGYDDVGAWELVRQVHDGNTLLTVSDKRAAEIGLRRATISNRAELLSAYKAGAIIEVEQTWSESLAGFFVNPFVRGILLVIMIIGFLLEYFSPGLIVPSAVALLALGILIGAPFVVGLASIWHVLLLVLGLALVIIELIATPTFGVLGIVGIVMMMAGLVLSVVPTGGGLLPAQGTAGQVVAASMSVVVALVLVIPAFIVLTRYFGALPMFNRLILVDETDQGGVTPDGRPVEKPYAHLSGDETIGAGKVSVGMAGVVSSTGLRPGGRIEIGELLIDATAPGQWVEPGTRVSVTEVHGNIIVVEPMDEG